MMTTDSLVSSTPFTGRSVKCAFCGLCIKVDGTHTQPLSEMESHIMGHHLDLWVAWTKENPGTVPILRVEGRD